MTTPKKGKAARRNPQLNPVMQAIQRDPEATEPGATPASKPHPITEALRLLRDIGNDDYHDAAHALENYQAGVMRAVAGANDRADATAKKFADFIDAVAVAVGMEEGSDSDDVLQTLVNHFEGVATPLVADVAGVDAEAFSRDASQHRGQILPMEPERPYFETVQGVAKVIEQHNGTALAAPLHDLPRVLSTMLADLRNEESEEASKLRATVQQQSKELREYVDPNALRQLVSDFGGGWADSPVDALREVLTMLQANQKPADFDEAVKQLVESSTRKENAIEAIKTILRLA